VIQTAEKGGGLEEQGLELNIKQTCFRQILPEWVGWLPPPDSIPGVELLLFFLGLPVMFSSSSCGLCRISKMRGLGQSTYVICPEP